MYTFVDKHETHHVYKHSDGYPTPVEEGAYAHIERAKKYAWPLPRFEADEFAAAFVTANKIKQYEDYPNSDKGMLGGGVRLMQSGDWQQVAPGDIAYRYEIRAVGKELHVKGWDVDCWGDKCKETPLPDFVIKSS